MRLPRLRHLEHLLPLDATATLTLSLDGAGVVVGVLPDGTAALLDLFRPRPRTVVCVGGVHMVQALSLRAAAAGAHVVVETGRPRLWAALAAATTGAASRVSVHRVGQSAPALPSAAAPLLLVRDYGARPPRGGVVPAAWQTVLTVLPFLDDMQHPRLADAALVGLQRLAPAEAQAAADALALPREVMHALPRLDDAVTLWCTSRSARYVRLAPTVEERELLGLPRRID